ncbi:hypothetical protein PWM43_00380 [Acetobacteraceae bacterium LMG 32668]|nr:hypothetical protein [Brytella acorum]MDF3623390.1 hypothetical protein [Brytella acorum]
MNTTQGEYFPASRTQSRKSLIDDPERFARGRVSLGITLISAPVKTRHCVGGRHDDLIVTVGIVSRITRDDIEHPH